MTESTLDSSSVGPARLDRLLEWLKAAADQDFDNDAAVQRFREAVLMLPAGGVVAAWDADILTVEQVHYAEQIRHAMGRLP